MVSFLKKNLQCCMKCIRLRVLKNPIFPHGDYDHFALDNFDEAEIYAEFRIQKTDTECLGNALVRADKIEGLSAWC